MRTLRLLVADDHQIVRQGLCALLGRQPDREIIAEARDGHEAVSMAQELKPNVAVLDISMPGLDGLGAAEQISKLVPETRVLALTMHAADAFVGEALEAGVRGFILKSDAGKDLVDAVSALGRNQTFFCPEVARIILDGHLKTTQKLSNETVAQNFLTGRHQEITQLLAEGKSSNEVSTVLDFVRYAVRNHFIDL